MKSIKQTLMSGAMILALSLAFTSCDDILGEWDRPAPNPVVPTPTPEPEPEPTPTPGLLTGKFTINASGDKIQFSQGNLQYLASTNTWRFAEQQYYYVGNAVGNTTSTGRDSQADWIDLSAGAQADITTELPVIYHIARTMITQNTLPMVMLQKTSTTRLVRQTGAITKSRMAATRPTLVGAR